MQKAHEWRTQLTFFPESREDKLERELARVIDQHDKVRKSLHAKNGELKKLYLELRNEFDDIKSALCKNNLMKTI